MTQPNEVAHPGSCRFYKSGDWELYAFFNDKGTKSEGQFGVLLHKGSIIGPEKEGKEINTELGKMKYYGLEKVHLWDTTGWHFANSDLIVHS